MQIVVVIDVPDEGTPLGYESDEAFHRDVERSINHRLVDEAGYLNNGDVITPTRVTTTVVPNLDALRISVEQVAGFLSDDNDRLSSADDLYAVADLLDHAPAHTLNRVDPQPEVPR